MKTFKLLSFVILSSIFYSCGPSLCDCVELDRRYNYVGGDYEMRGEKYNRSSKQKGIDEKFEKCRDEFDGMDNVRRRSSECN